jgi:manganese/zinc/iron transport system permease protein
MSSGTVIVIAGVLVATACALLGSFLVLRRMSMMADAISHAILPGLVAGFFLARGPNLLAGFIGAAFAAFITVSLVEAIQKSGRVGNDSAIGIVFPAMFALGTVVVSRYFANVHLDADAILYGNIEFAAQDTLIVNGLSWGPQSFWVMGSLLVMNLLFITLFYKELKLATFDAGLAATLGFSPHLIHYGLMVVVSLTAVGAFTAVGAVLTVALMIVPAATAYLLTNRLKVMIGLAALVGALSAVGGYYVAVIVDTSIAGAITSVAGFLFLLAMIFSPSQGMVARVIQLRQQRLYFATENLVIHLSQHENTLAAESESSIKHLSTELRWKPEFAQRVIQNAIRQALIVRTNGHLALTETGREFANQAE